jgi:hypothetical protein
MNIKLLWYLIALFLISGIWVFGEGVYFEGNTNTPGNGKLYIATSTPLKINLTNPQLKNFVVVDDDPQTTVYYGDAGCSAVTGESIAPGEKVTFTGVPNPFNLYVCTESASAEVRVVEQ